MTDPAATMSISANLGIDLNTALEILLRRSPSVHTQNKTIENENPHDIDITTLHQKLNGISSKLGCGCCPDINSLHELAGGLVASEQQKSNGQVIDIGATTLDYDNLSNCEEKGLKTEVKPALYNESIAADILDKQERLKITQQQAVARQVQLLSTIQSMTINDTISAIFHTQEERVKCYRFFDE